MLVNWARGNPLLNFQSKVLFRVTRFILVPVPEFGPVVVGVPGVPGVPGMPGVPGVPGEFGGIVELGDIGTWLWLTMMSSSSVGEVAKVFTMKENLIIHTNLVEV